MKLRAALVAVLVFLFDDGAASQELVAADRSRQDAKNAKGATGLSLAPLRLGAKTMQPARLEDLSADEALATATSTPWQLTVVDLPEPPDLKNQLGTLPRVLAPDCPVRVTGLARMGDPATVRVVVSSVEGTVVLALGDTLPNGLRFIGSRRDVALFSDGTDTFRCGLFEQ